MAEQAPRIKQGSKVYVFTGTEEKVIGDTIWTRDRYDNTNGNPTSYLLVNFVDTGKPATKSNPPKSRQKTKTLGSNIRQYIDDWKAKEKSNGR